MGMQIAFGLLALFSIFKLIFKNKTRITFHPFYYFIFCYLMANAITILLTDNHYPAFKSFINNDWIIFLVPFFISNSPGSSVRRQGFYILLVSAALVGVYGIVQHFVGIEFFRHKLLGHEGNFFRSVGGYSFYLAYAANQLFAFCLAFSFLLLSKNKNKKILLSVIVLIIFLSILTTYARSTWLALIIVIFLGSILVSKKTSFYVIGVSIIIVTIIFLLIPDLQHRFISIFDPAKNETRINLWKTSRDIFLDHPWIGVGQGNFNKFFRIYQVPGFYDSSCHAHNDYINIMVINGLLGILSWLGMWTAWFYYALKAFYSNKIDVPDRRILLGSILGIAGILIAAFFQCYYRDLENNIFWWFLAATAIQIMIDARSNNDQ